jgi:hypothetical protein
MKTLDQVIKDALRFHTNPQNAAESLYENVRDFVADKIIECIPPDSSLDENKIMKDLYRKLTVRKVVTNEPKRN